MLIKKFMNTMKGKTRENKIDLQKDWFKYLLTSRYGIARHL